jgi:hypothetical protein
VRDGHVDELEAYMLLPLRCQHHALKKNQTFAHKLLNICIFAKLFIHGFRIEQIRETKERIENEHENSKSKHDEHVLLEYFIMQHIRYSENKRGKMG